MHVARSLGKCGDWPKELACFSIDRGYSLLDLFFLELTQSFLGVGPLLSGLVTLQLFVAISWHAYLYPW